MGIFKTIACNDKYYLDLLESGKYMISCYDTKIKTFEQKDAHLAIMFYLAKIEPVEVLTEQEEVEAIEYLKNAIR